MRELEADNMKPAKREVIPSGRGVKARIIVAFAVIMMITSNLFFTAGGAAASSCRYHRSGDHWVCITPGAFCPKAAHHHYGLSKYNLKRKYWCVYNHGWRWEPRR
jgi:hypothetical protein